MYVVTSLADSGSGTLREAAEAFGPRIVLFNVAGIIESKKPINGHSRRWVIYQGANDASRVPPAWFGWLHHQTDVVPTELPAPRPWVKEPVPNLTGTAAAYRPVGALERGGNRAAATGDYEAWSPN